MPCERAGTERDGEGYKLEELRSDIWHQVGRESLHSWSANIRPGREGKVYSARYYRVLSLLSILKRSLTWLRAAGQACAVATIWAQRLLLHECNSLPPLCTPPHFNSMRRLDCQASHQQRFFVVMSCSDIQPAKQYSFTQPTPGVDHTDTVHATRAPYHLSLTLAARPRPLSTFITLAARPRP